MNLSTALIGIDVPLVGYLNSLIKLYFKSLLYSILFQVNQFLFSIKSISFSCRYQ